MSAVEHEDRHNPRAPFRGEVTLWRNREPVPATARDIGPGGVFLETDAAMSEGALCVLRLKLPDQHGFTVMGRTVRSERGRPPLRAPGLAVEFVSIAPSQRFALRRFALRHRPVVTPRVVL